MLDSVLHDLLDPAIGDSRALGDLVEGPTFLEDGQEGFRLALSLLGLGELGIDRLLDIERRHLANLNWVLSDE
jgi:hypothetical protein